MIEVEEYAQLRVVAFPNSLGEHAKLIVLEAHGYKFNVKAARELLASGEYC